jgi:hypothetical protein
LPPADKKEIGMDIQAGANQGADSGVLQPLAASRQRQGQEVLRRAQPVMGGGALEPSPLDIDPDLVRAVLDVEGDIVVRRRASSTGECGVSASHGWREMAFVRMIAKDIRRENHAGVNKAGRELRKLGCTPRLIDELIAMHHNYYRITRVLAGGTARASDAQLAQAFALCVFDMNRQITMREVLQEGEPTAPSSSASSSSSASRAADQREFQRMLVGAKRLTEFDELRPTLELWVHIRLDARGPEREVMLLSLAKTIGLFQTNVLRFMNAFDEAMQSGPKVDLLQRMPSCLIKQWMTGCSDQEREALRGKSGVQCAEFHRKLSQQYALLCRSFGVPLPAMAELILIDSDD